MAAMIRSLSILTFLVIMVAATIVADARQGQAPSASMAVRHEEWMAKHGRLYKDSAEKEMRLKAFERNVLWVESFMNNTINSDVSKKKKHGYKVALNHFADRTSEELRSHHNRGLGPTQPNGDQYPLPKPTTFKYANVKECELPRSVDWRDKGVAPSVKHQGSHCGSCWAFCATGAVESLMKITTGKMVDLSVQELIECDAGPGRDTGCNGGYPVGAFDWIVDHGGITNNKTYPYRLMGDGGTCQKRLAAADKVVARISGFEIVPPNDEVALMKAVANQPVTVGFSIDTNTKDFGLYAGGIYDGPCGHETNHCLLAVGYGTDDNGIDYWLLQNSWSALWGEEGYIKLPRRATNDKRGKCLMYTYNSYPLP